MVCTGAPPPDLGDLEGHSVRVQTRPPPLVRARPGGSGWGVWRVPVGGGAAVLWQGEGLCDSFFSAGGVSSPLGAFGNGGGHFVAVTRLPPFYGL